MDLLLFILGVLGFFISFLFIIVSLIKKKSFKKPMIVLGVSILACMIGLLMPTSQTPKDSSNPVVTSETKKPEEKPVEKISLTEADKSLLTKAYSELDTQERTQLDTIQEKFEKLSDTDKQAIQMDYDRLIAEKTAQLAKEAEEKAAADAKKAEEAAIAEAKKAEEAAIAEAQKYDTGITYEQLARTPDDYKDQFVKLSGTVLQTIEGSGETNLRIAVNGDYNSVIFVGYDPAISSVRILEDDSVTVKGQSIGLYTYESAMGSSISIPGIYVSEIELNQ